ncbi:JmjC domain-containing protein [Micromonospora sp. LOL_021]|uniref:JmjC domain-containing protein n=1 Tax=Micromonospora sp. LOL_021 TaxID=3345417 RepID=UPI003A8C4CC7
MTGELSASTVAVLRAWGMPEDFTERYWRRAPVAGRAAQVVPGRPTAADIQALSGQALSADRVAVSTGGRLHHPSEYTHELVLAGRTVSGVVDPARLTALVDAGATTVLANLEHWMPQVTELAATLAADFGCEVQAHVFRTAAGHAGLTPHIDGEDNFLLQIDGAKAWSLWRTDSQQPVHLNPDTLGPPTVTVTLTAGDTLYIPVGWAHAAVATDGGSTHITYQVVPVPVLDAVLDQLAAALEPVLADALLPAPGGSPLPDGVVAGLVDAISAGLRGQAGADHDSRPDGPYR